MVFNRKPNEPRPADQPGAQQAQPNRPPPFAPPLPRPSSSATIPAESIIGSDLTIEGQTITIRCRGSLRVNGNIQADVHSLQLVVGEQASISGAIAADTVDVFGRVSGAILGARVVLHQTARVDGDIHSHTLAIEQGASFDGRSRKVTDPSEIAPQLEPAGGGYTSPPAIPPPPPALPNQSAPAPLPPAPLQRLYS